MGAGDGVAVHDADRFYPIATLPGTGLRPARRSPPGGVPPRAAPGDAGPAGNAVRAGPGV